MFYLIWVSSIILCCICSTCFAWFFYGKLSFIKGSEILEATLGYLISVYDITGLERISVGLFS